MNQNINMTREENVFYAKRNLVDTIYKSAKLEGLAVTFPQTEAIIHGGQVSNLRADDIQAINNLKHAWNFVFENLDYPLDFAYVCKLHHFIGSNLILNPGFVRKGEVFIGGIDPSEWVPAIPDEEEFKLTLRRLRLIEDPTDRAVETMLYCMRTQPFWDGNKRVSMLAANQILISHGCGILSVHEADMGEFKNLLVEYYKSGEKTAIKNFVVDRCIHGVDFSKERNPFEQELPPLDETMAKAEAERDRANLEKTFGNEPIQKRRDER